MSNRLALMKETLNLLVLNFGGMLIGLVATVLITRALGAEARGVYAWIFTVAALAGQVGTLVTYNSARRMGSVGGSGGLPDEKAWPALAGTFTGLALLGWGLTLPALVWGLVQPIGRAHPGLLLLAWVSFPLLSASTALSGLIHLRRQAGDVLLPALLPRLAHAATVVALWATRHLTLTMAVLLNLLVAMMSVVANGWWLGVSPWRWRFDRRLARQAARFLGATWLASLAGFTAPRVSMLILPAHVGLADLGYYSIAATLLEVALMLPNAVTSVLVSHFTRGESSARNRRHTLGLLLAVLAGAAAVGAVLAPYVLPRVFGPGFAASVAPFRVLLLALLLQAPLAVYTSQLTARAHSRGLLLPPLASLAASACLAWVLAPEMGIMGAAWATVGGYAVMLLTTLPFCFKSPLKSE